MLRDPWTYNNGSRSQREKDPQRDYASALPQRRYTYLNVNWYEVQCPPPILSAFFCGLVTMECIPEYMHYAGKGKDKEEVRGEFVVVRTLPSLLYGA